MTIFTLILDLAVINAYALFKKIKPDENVTIREFKRLICEQLCLPQQKRNSRNDRENGETITSECLSQGIGSIASKHVIVMNRKTNGRVSTVNCHLCSLLGQRRSTRYGCIACQKCFHPE